MNSTIIVDLLYVEWGSRNRHSLVEAVRTVKAAGAEVGHLVVVDNKKESASVESIAARKVTVVDGDNFARDFSGWDTAYRIVAQASQADVLLFANDTLAAHRRPRWVRRWRAASWIRYLARSPEPKMFGPLAPIDLEHHQPQQWMFGTLRDFVTSYLYGMTPDAARRVFPICAIEPTIERVMQNEMSPAGLFTDELPKIFRDRVSDWLLTQGKWRYAATLNPENFDFFRLKAKSVLYEYALSTIAGERGVKIHDVNSGRGNVDKVFAALTRFWLNVSSTARFPALATLNRRLLDRH